MIDKIPMVGESWFGTLLGFIVLIFAYYFFWTIFSMILLNRSTKHAFFHGDKSTAKDITKTIIYLFLILGLNLSMYSLGLYGPEVDTVFLFLVSIFLASLIVTMIEIMESNHSGGEEFYNIVFGFVLTVGFLSPTKGLITLNLEDKLYLLGGLLVTTILFSLGFMKTWCGKINSRYVKYIMKQIKIKKGVKDE